MDVSRGNVIDLMYVINSVPTYFDVAGVRCLNSLLRYGIPKENILVIFGNCNMEGSEYRDGVLYIYATHNSSDYTSFIEATKLTGVKNWCFIHDTCEVTSLSFYKKTMQMINSKEYNAVDSCTFSPVGFTNLGLFKHEFLISIKDYLNSLIDINKHRGMYTETVINRLGKNIGFPCERKYLPEKNIYGNNVPRKTVQYDFGLNKYQGPNTLTTNLAAYKP